ncbi:MAG: GNAT family N-acetyltransferase [Acidimicrobiales bacterium]
MTLRVEALGDHRLDEFRCGNADLDDWLKHHARGATGHGTRTYVVVHEANLVGYFAIAPHYLRRQDAPRKIARGAPSEIPAVLLAKLALDQSIQGQGLGSELLVFALRRIVEAARQAGGRLVVVDAIDDPARRFYEHHDFEPLPDDDRRLMMKLSTAAKALKLDWP